jgi:cellulose synthase/poly-beta-1,6-N-acetylglucosamine synthase-like glycosyltransferase
MLISNIIYTVFIASLIYFLTLTIYYIFLALIGSFEDVKRAFQGEQENYSLFYFSHLKLPVSIVVPVHNEKDWIADCVKSLISLNYPEFEIILVNDGSTDNTLDIMDGILKLQPADAMYIRHYKDGRVRGILKSSLFPNVTVVDKDAGNKKAGAVNAGLNIARHDYVCVIDADTILERDALLKVMVQIEKEPDKVIGAGSSFGLVNGFKIKDGVILERNFSYNPLIAYQNIEYIRSFIGNRLAWSKYNAMPNVAGGFGVWRKDVLYELGGFSSDFTCEDIELTFRAHEYIVKNREKGYKIIMLPYYVGWTEGPATVRALIMQRNRWQRVVDETVWRYKYMTFNPKFKLFGFLAMPYFVFYEVLGVFAEILSIVLVAVGAVIGVLNWNIFLAYFLFMLLTQAFVALLSLLAFVERQRVFNLRYVVYLAILTCLEFFWYRWIISAAKVMGTIGFLNRRRSYDQYARQKRA